MYFPRSIKEMFTKSGTNLFNKELIEQQREYIKSNVDVTLVDLYRDLHSREVKHKLVNRPLIHDWKKPAYALDAPVAIYDFPKHTDYGVHVIGVDSIGEDETSSSESLGYITVLRRLHSDLEDPFRGKQVASYLGRKKSVELFHEMLLNLAEWYNAQILYEHADRNLLSFFEKKHKTHLLIDTVPLQREIAINSKAKNQKGLRPTVTNKKFLLNSTLGWVNTEMDDDSYGYSNIMDDVLLQQLAEYDPDENLDCYIGFSHAVAAYNYFEKFGVPQVENSNNKTIKTSIRKKIKNAFNINSLKKSNAFGF